MSALYSSKRLALAGLCAAVLVIATSSALAQDDPPPEAGRISYISGNVSIQPVTSDDWGQAYPNLPVGPGDRIFTDSDGRVEIQVGQTYVRIGPNSDVTLVDDSQFNINFGVAQGSIHLHSFGLWPRQLLDISTPNGNAEIANSGDLRVDVLPTDGATVFTNLGQFADVTGAGDFRQELDYGQSLELAGSNPVYPQWLQPAGPDDLDSWSQQRDQQLSRVVSFQYVSPDIPGAADLDASGEWQAGTEYGAIWYPRDVSADWSPYHNGHWINRDPWGWVWVEDESWGYAPFHYGRWVNYHDRWGWVPGPVNVRPIWSPALVVFAGGGGGGVGLSVWFPLGPGEAYRPWYHCSPRYIDQVNITNIREAPRVHVQNTYVNIVNVTNVTNVTYVNRDRGVSAMRQDDFAAGRSARNVAVRVDSREVQQMRPLAQPNVAPSPRAIVSRPVTRPVPVSNQRPMLINQQGRQIAAKPNATPVAAPVRQMPQAARPLPGRTIVAAPARPVQNGPGGNRFPAAQGNPAQRPNQPYTPNPGSVPRANPVAPVPPMQRPNNQPTSPANNPQPDYRQQNPNNQQPGRPNYPQPNQPQNQQPTRPVQPSPEQPVRPNQPNNQQPIRPVQPNPDQPVRPNQPNYQQPNQPNTQPLRPNQPQTQPPAQQNRQDFGPVQPPRQRDVAPPPPQNTRPQDRPAPPPVQQERPLPPPPQSRPTPPPARQEYAPPPQPKPAPAPKPNNDNKDQKKNDKKDDKKDDKKHD
jgi:hypothetical protein